MALVVGLLLTGCSAPAVKERVVLLPDSSGRVGALVVTGPKSRTELRSAYASSTLASGARLQQTTLSPAEVQRRYGNLLAALPPAAQTFVLYFEGDSNTMTEESAEQARRVAERIAGLPVTTEIFIVGHTDLNGPADHNEKLSRERALAVRDYLAGRGVDTRRLSVEARGERDPAVPTADGVLEPRNRRVEITVR